MPTEHVDDTIEEELKYVFEMLPCIQELSDIDEWKAVCFCSYKSNIGSNCIYCSEKWWLVRIYRNNKKSRIIEYFFVQGYDNTSISLLNKFVTVESWPNTWFININTVRVMTKYVIYEYKHIQFTFLLMRQACEKEKYQNNIGSSFCILSSAGKYQE